MDRYITVPVNRKTVANFINRMNIDLLKKIANKPKLYDKGTSVMWTDPHISKHLLELHINPDIDTASRSQDKINSITKWILEQIDKPKRKILDLGCGPGLYAELLAQNGHSVTGIDFSANTIQYAAKNAKELQLEIEYLNTDYLNLNYDNQFDVILLIYLDFCALIPSDRDRVLKIVHKALKKGGIFIFDVVNEKNIDKKTIQQSWEIQEKGFWKNKPYVALSNGYHYPEARVLANHHIIIDQDYKIDSYIFWTHYYEQKDLIPILESKGFTDTKNYENILPEGDCWNGNNVTFYKIKK